MYYLYLLVNIYNNFTNPIKYMKLFYVCIPHICAIHTHIYIYIYIYIYMCYKGKSADISINVIYMYTSSI